MADMTLQAAGQDGRGELAELTDAQAWALAELCKRITWSDCRRNAVDDNEAYLMIDATAKLGSLLAKVGYAPR